VIFAVGAVAAVAACAGFGLRSREPAEQEIEPSAISANLEFDLRPSLRGTNVEPDAAPPSTKVWRLEKKIPKDSKGRGYDELYPTIVQWVHPVTAAPELVPDNPMRHFGAGRDGVARGDCGSGHCGVDLEGPRGRAIVSVQSGVVVRVERRYNGGDGISGRFVRVQHDEGYLTSYMHMDTIDPKLEVGDRIQQGQYLGTLGSTGVSANVPHLHFALEVPLTNRYKGDLPYSATKMLNPAPFVLRAKIIEVPERRPLKPAT
jgi:murein DD-endopeptidase MepM/ murein hydrolase activator NlpD